MNIKLDYLNGETLQGLSVKYKVPEDEIPTLLGDTVKVKPKSVEGFQYVCSEYLKGVSPKDIAKSVNRTTAAILLTLNRYDLRKPKPTASLTEKQVCSVLDLYSKGESLTAIGRTVDRDVDTMRYYLKREGVYEQKHFVNTMEGSYVDTFGDKAEDYYFYGFCLADGSVSKNRLMIELNDRDEEILEKFRDRYHPNAKICHRTTRPLASLNLCTKAFVDKIRAMGLRENKKALGVEFIPEILYSNKEFAAACILGYIDGDGWQSLVKSVSYRVGMTGEDHTMQLLRKLYDIHFKEVVYCYSQPKPTYSNLIMNRQLGTLKFLDYLYSCTDIYLERKRKKWLSALEMKITSGKAFTRVTKEVINNMLSLTEEQRAYFLSKVPE